RIVIGADNPRTIELLKALYAPFNRSHERIIAMDIRSAELTKYAANAMLATKISFMNELSNLAELLGADIEKVRNGIGSDSRIGYSFIYPGCGYGGSCFPKDVQALEKTAEQVGYKAELLQAVENVNHRQKLVLLNKINKHYNGDIKGKTFALWGLAFKPKTDDMREAPSIDVVNALLDAGVKVTACDPAAVKEAKHIWGDAIAYVDTPEQACKGAETLVVLTEWLMFREPDWANIAGLMQGEDVFDARNLYAKEELAQHGLNCISIGRGKTCL
ncbi:MAG: nucleotide sugar dehydrogenase, partial [Ghiorsea sp.]|nr:nucleotide sugar dehydrogenase [Ghiorsea sp.]